MRFILSKEERQKKTTEPYVRIPDAIFYHPQLFNGKIEIRIKQLMLTPPLKQCMAALREMLETSAISETDKRLIFLALAFSHQELADDKETLQELLLILAIGPSLLLELAVLWGNKDFFEKAQRTVKKILSQEAIGSLIRAANYHLLKVLVVGDAQSFLQLFQKLSSDDQKVALESANADGGYALLRESLANHDPLLFFTLLEYLGPDQKQIAMTAADRFSAYSLYSEAAAFGRVDVLQHLDTLFAPEQLTDAIYFAARNGRLEVLGYFKQLLTEEEFQKMVALVHAEKNLLCKLSGDGHWDILEYLTKNMSQENLEGALQRSNTELFLQLVKVDPGKALDFLQSKISTKVLSQLIGARAVELVSRSGNLEMLKKYLELMLKTKRVEIFCSIFWKNAWLDALCRDFPEIYTHWLTQKMDPALQKMDPDLQRTEPFPFSQEFFEHAFLTLTRNGQLKPFDDLWAFSVQYEFEVSNLLLLSAFVHAVGTNRADLVNRLSSLLTSCIEIQEPSFLISETIKLLNLDDFLESLLVLVRNGNLDSIKKMMTNDLYQNVFNHFLFRDDQRGFLLRVICEAIEFGQKEILNYLRDISIDAGNHHGLARYLTSQFHGDGGVEQGPLLGICKASAKGDLPTLEYVKDTVMPAEWAQIITATVNKKPVAVLTEAMIGGQRSVAEWLMKDPIFKDHIIKNKLTPEWFTAVASMAVEAGHFWVVDFLESLANKQASAGGTPLLSRDFYYSAWEFGVKGGNLSLSLDQLSQKIGAKEIQNRIKEQYYDLCRFVANRQRWDVLEYLGTFCDLEEKEAIAKCVWSPNLAEAKRGNLPLFQLLNKWFPIAKFSEPLLESCCRLMDLQRNGKDLPDMGLIDYLLNQPNVCAYAKMHCQGNMQSYLARFEENKKAMLDVEQNLSVADGSQGAQARSSQPVKSSGLHRHSFLNQITVGQEKGAAAAAADQSDVGADAVGPDTVGADAVGADAAAADAANRIYYPYH